MAKYTVNKAGVAKARELIDSGHYVVRSRWSEAQPTKDDENRFLRRHSIEDYSEWHLALTEGVSETAKGHYGFVFGDFRRLHRMALIACIFRAAEWDHKQIELAAHDLLQRLDKARAKKPARRAA